MAVTATPASFRRRLGAMLYDAIAVVMLQYFAAFIPVLAAGDALAPGNALFTAYLTLVSFAYFWLCWRRGRTLGMQAWKLEIRTVEGKPLNSSDCALRFLAAIAAALPLGLGYLAALGNRERIAWHDRLSGTRLLRVTQAAR